MPFFFLFFLAQTMRFDVTKKVANINKRVGKLMDLSKTSALPPNPDRLKLIAVKEEALKAHNSRNRRRSASGAGD